MGGGRSDREREEAFLAGSSFGVASMTGVRAREYTDT